PGHTQLPYDQYIQRCAERVGDLCRDRHTAADQPEHDDVVAAGVSPQVLGEDLAGMAPVVVRHILVCTRIEPNPPASEETRRRIVVPDRYLQCVRQDLSILRDRRFTLLFAARTASVLGSAFGPVALAFGVLALPGATATTLSLVTAAEAL